MAIAAAVRKCGRNIGSLPSVDEPRSSPMYRLVLGALIEMLRKTRAFENPNPTRQRGIDGEAVPSSLTRFEVAFFEFTLPLAGGSDAVAAGEGPLRALEPDSPRGRVICGITTSNGISLVQIHASREYRNFKN